MPMPPGIPDHEGRPLSGLDAALRAIDRDYRLDPAYRMLRAAACYNHGDAQGWHREMTVAVDEFAERRGMTRREATRLLLPASEWLAVWKPRLRN
jgi:hypothetical protein